MSYKKSLFIITLCSFLTAGTLFSGCSGNESSVSKDTEASAENESTSESEDKDTASLDLSEAFTERDLRQDYDEEDAVNITLSGSSVEADSESAVEISGSVITIKEEGVYVFSGSLTDGQIIVDADKENDKVQIVLKDASINTSGAAAIYVKSADKVFLTTAEGTENIITASGQDETDDDTNVDGAVFSKDDLVINGLGTLSVESAYGNGIVSKDDLKVTGSETVISSKNKHGLESNDDLLIADGNITVNESYEGMEGGDIVIYGGTLLLESSDDGINALSSLTINGGEIEVIADGDGLDSNGEMTINGGTTYISGPTDSGNGALDCGDGYEIVVNGGTLIAAGSSGMAEGFSSESTQGAILYTFNTSLSGDIEILDKDGNILASYSPKKTYSAVNITANGIVSGETYTINAGSETAEITMDSITYGQGMGMGGFGGGGRGGMGFGKNESESEGDADFNGERPESFDGGEVDFDGEMPEGFNGEKPEAFNGEMPDFNGEKPEGFGGKMGGSGGFPGRKGN